MPVRNLHVLIYQFGFEDNLETIGNYFLAKTSFYDVYHVIQK